MIRRIILTLTLISLPLSALAGTADSLGPSTSSSLGGTADTGTSSLLQPAGTSSLQPSGEQGTGVNQAPANSNLQPAGNASDSKDLLVTEGSGSQHQLTDTNNLNLPLLAGLGAMFVLIVITLLLVENRRLRLLAAPDQPGAEPLEKPAVEPGETKDGAKETKLETPQAQDDAAPKPD